MAASACTPESNTNNTTASNTPATQAGCNGLPAGQKMPASEVGWYFVHEYYTFLNKDPSRLHCFYGQKSTLIHGIEGETVIPSQGEKEIKEKFQSLNLDNCRVLITNVDSQASINGGILIQVLGEISNRNEVSRRFAQTFFLDVQPNVTNGYYVLNDIIRFLSDDDIEIYNREEEAGVSASPTGTLVEEPICARVELSGPSDSVRSAIVAESIQASMDTNTTTLSSKEDESLLQAAPINVEVADNNRLHIQSPLASALNSNSKSIANTQFSQSGPLLPMSNHNEQPLNVNIQESFATLVGNASQGHTNNQVLPVQSYQSGLQSTQQPSTIAIEQEQITILTNVESQSSQALKASQSLQGNNSQALKSTIASSLTSLSVKQDDGQRSAIISNTEQINALQDVEQVLSTQNNVLPLNSGSVMQSKSCHPADIPKQTPTVTFNTLQSQINDQSLKSANNNTQYRSKLSFEDNNGPTAKFTKQGPMTGPQDFKLLSRPESPVGVYSQLSVVNNNKEHNKQQVNTTQNDKKKNIQNVPKNTIMVGTNDPEIHDEKLSHNHISQTKTTWASLAANEPEKWSTNALAETKGVVAPVSSKPVSQSQFQTREIRDRRSEGQKNNNRRNSDTSLSIYVKGVTPSMSYEQLKAAFTAFGHVKHLDVVLTKSCAFVEYNNAESYRRALEAHTVDVGGETVSTEERRIRRNNGKAPRGRF